MLDNYTQNLQEQIGQLGKLLGVQNPTVAPEPVPAANRFDCVDGLDGAKAFMNKMLSGAKHIVWDNNSDTFFVLEKDANGQPARIKICQYTVELEPTMEDKYVSKDDFNALAAKIDELLKGVKKDG